MEAIFNWQNEIYRYRRYFLRLKTLSLQKKVRVYTEIVFSILTVAFFILFAIRPTLITIAGLIKEIKDKKMIAQKLEEKINNLNLAQNEYFSLQDSFYLVDQALPKTSQISLLVRQIEALATKEGVVLEAIDYSTLNFKEEVGKGNPEEIEIKMVLSGEYQNLKNFLTSLSNFRRIFRLEAFGFKTAKEKEEKKLLLSLSGKVFFFGGKNEQ